MDEAEKRCAADEPLSSRVVNMGTCHVWIIDGAVEAVFTDPRNVDSDAKIRLNRSATEPIGKGLSRACNTLSKRKKSKTKEEAVWEASMFDLDGSTFVEDDVVGDLAWKDGGLMQFRVSGASPATYNYRIARDYPRLHEIRMPMLAVVGHPVSCNVVADFAESFEYRWEHGNGVCTDTNSFTPTAEDVGYNLTVSITPVNKVHRGEVVQRRCKYGVIMVNPKVFASLDARINSLGISPNAFRVMSYNILWGLSDKALEKPVESAQNNKQQKMITQVSELPVEIRSREYRQHILLKEIIGFAPDIACLQEVTSHVYDHFMLPFLECEGYRSQRAEKNSELATLWKRDRFEEVAAEAWRIEQLLDSPVNSEIKTEMLKNVRIEKHFRKQPHVAQVVKLKEIGSKKEVIVVNVHLIQGASSREQFRALQACLVLRALQQWPQYRDCEQAPALIFLGDLNCLGPEHPIEATLELLENGKLPSDHHSFVNGRVIGRVGRAGEKVERGHEVTEVVPDEEQCVSPINSRGGTCPNRRAEGSDMCWDHNCQCCGVNLRARWKESICECCFNKNKVAPPLPQHIAEETLDFHHLTLAISDGKIYKRGDKNDENGDKNNTNVKNIPSITFANAYKEITGTRAMYITDFAPSTGEPTKGDPWVELKDHVYFQPSTLRVVDVVRAPELDSIRGVPNLTWGSDHMAYVVDFQFKQREGADFLDK